MTFSFPKRVWEPTGRLGPNGEVLWGSREETALDRDTRRDEIEKFELRRAKVKDE